MRTEQIEPSYWAVIPAQVRYDANLPPGAKLLYAEISSLTDQRGYCFASNKYFADLYGSSERTVQRYLDALKASGLIHIQDGDGGTGRRKIYAGINPLSENHDKNVVVPENHDKNVGVTTTKMSGTNNVFNKKDEQEPPISPNGKTPKAPMPKELMDRVAAYAGPDLELRDALIEFARVREKNKKPIKTNRMMTLLLSRLNEFSCGRRRDKLKIIENATIGAWLSFYPLDRDEIPAASGNTVEAPPGVETW